MKLTRGKKGTLLILLACLAVAGAIAALGISSELIVRHYRVESDKLGSTARVALLADLHSCDYGEGQSELIEAVVAEEPDIVLLAGDIIDEKLPEENAVALMSGLSALYPCYYVTGNHEWKDGALEKNKDLARACGVTVLENEHVTVAINGQELNICGVDDPWVYDDGEYLDWVAQSVAGADAGLFTILMAHRPEFINDYLNYDFDLILSGHTHGGQWRIPGLVNGLIAPNQGLFPRYAGGRYDFGSRAMIISRGLARESTRVPRLFNPPELVVIDLSPPQGGEASR